MIKKTIVILFLLSMNQAKAGILQDIKDMAIGTIAGGITSLVINRCDKADTEYYNVLKAVGGLFAAACALKSLKKNRKDINSINVLFCILTTAILVNTNLWDNVFGNGYDSDSNSDSEDEQDEE